MTKMLLVTQHFWPENFKVNDLVEGIVSRGIDVDVLCGLPNYPQGEWFPGYSKHGPFNETYHSAHIYRCREIPRKGNTSKNIFLNYTSWPLYARRAVGRLPGGYDAVLCYNTSPVLMSWPAIYAAKTFHAPLALYVLDLWPENLYSVMPVKNPCLRSIAQSVSDWHYRRADRIITLSSGMEKTLRERVGDLCASSCVERHRQYCVIPQYCEDFYAVPKRQITRPSSADPPGFTLMFAGNLSPAQDLEGVLESVSMAQAKLDKMPQAPDIRFVIYGDGMSRASIEKTIAGHGLQNVVELCESIPASEIPEAFTHADALLVSLSNSPSLGLTIPAKLASSMASRKPLLVSISGEGAQAARESGGALVCDAGNRQSLADNIVALATLPKSQLAEMGDRSFDYYYKNYRRDMLIEKLLDFCLSR